MSRVQVQVALDKEKRPELYCPTRKCLWRTFDGSHCPRHGGEKDPSGIFKKGAP